MNTIRLNNRDMVQRLPADAPYPAAANHAALLDHLVGTWSAEYFRFPETGEIRRRHGEVRFGWVLDGHALQDIWIWQPDAEHAVRRIGTTIRFYDVQHHVWRIVWIEPAGGVVVELEGGEVDGRIVLRGCDQDGSRLRWSFNDIEADSFVWRGERSGDEGRTWRLEAEYRMQRARLA